MGRALKGLIMEGGAMRGMFTCGVIDVFLENRITFDGAAGISAGAAFGVNFKSGQIGRPLRYNKKYGRDPRYCSLRSLLLTGDLYGAEFCYHTLPDELDIFDRKAFRENPLAFWIGATDVRTGKAVYHLCSDGGDEDIQWMRASASMPLVSRPVAIGDLLLLDGGISDAVPFAFMEEQGYTRNVLVMTQPRGYLKSPSRLSGMLPLLLHKYPALARTMAGRHEMYNREMKEVDRREDDGTSLVIRPPAPLGIRRVEGNPDELERVYRIGRKEAERRLDDIRRFLADP